MTSRVSIPLAVCVVAAAIALFGLLRPGPDNNAAAAPSSEAAVAAGPTVEIQDFAFGGDLTVEPGASIAVHNADSAPHTFTATDGSFDTGTVAGGATVTVTAPTEPGAYQLFCAIHPSMTAALVVEA